MVVGVNDLRPAVAHASAEVKDLVLDHFDALHPPSIVENLDAVDDGVRHRLDVSSDITFWGTDRQRSHERAARSIAHVMAQRHCVVLGTGVHRVVVPADIAIAEQARPASLELLSVLLRIVPQLPDILHHGHLLSWLAAMTCHERMNWMERDWRPAAPYQDGAWTKALPAIPAFSTARRSCVFALSGRIPWGGREYGYSPVGRPMIDATYRNASPQCVK